MKRIFSAFLACTICAPLLIAPVQAAKGETAVRVGLAYGTSAPAAPQLTSADGAGFLAGEMDGTQFVSDARLTAETITVTPDGDGLAVTDAASGQVLYQTRADTLALSPRGSLTQFDQNRYYGDFVFRRAGSRVEVINYVPLETYLKGVVPYEMSASWPIEALKAQAVCARSYAGGQKSKHAADGFDLCATTHCEVYRGTARATANSDLAVEQTEGQYLWYQDQKVVGYYFSSDGGATEDAANVWGGSYAYLTGVPDPYEKTAQAGANAVWTVTLTAEQIADKLRVAGRTIGTVASVQVTARTAMGNVKELTVTDTAGTQVKLTRSACRTVLGLNSIRYAVGAAGTTPVRPGGQAVQTDSTASGSRYAISADGAVKRVSLSDCTVLTPAGPQAMTGLGSTTPSGSAAADAPVTGTQFVFAGTGWGHSVGMSQHGAKAMAEQGFSYDQILQYYFTGVTVR